MELLELLIRAIRALAGFLAKPFCYLLMGMTAAGAVLLIVLVQVEVYKDKEKHAKEKR